MDNISKLGAPLTREFWSNIVIYVGNYVDLYIINEHHGKYSIQTNR